MSVCRSPIVWRKRKQCVNLRVPENIIDWLFDSSSLTARLIATCNGKFRVEVLSVERALPRLDEILALHMRQRNQALVRQVLLYCNEQPLVYARTIIPLTSIRGPLRGLTRLGNKPLGAVLFSNKTMRRSEIEVTQMTPAHPCYAAMKNSGGEIIWGRRSVFHLHRMPLLVSEFFLPAIK